MLAFNKHFELHRTRRAAEVASKTIANEISDARKLLRDNGLDGNSDSAWLRDADKFQAAVDTSIKSIASVEAQRTFLSNVNQVRETACLQLPNISPGNTLWEAYLKAHATAVARGELQPLLTKNAFILRCFNATGINRRKLNSKKIQVHGPTWDRIAALETELCAPGELTRFLINTAGLEREKFQTEYSKRLQAALDFPYRCDEEKWHKSTHGEWADLVFFKTQPAQAKRKWHLDGFDLKDAQRWRIRSKDRNNSSDTKRSYETELFFGWCLLPKVMLSNGKENLWRSGAGLEAAQLSLGLLFNFELVAGYTAFRCAHTVREEESIAGNLGVFNHGCTIFYQFIGSLLSTKAGFIYFRPDLYFRPEVAGKEPELNPQNMVPSVPDKFYNPLTRKKEPVDDLEERWYRFCNETRTAFLDIKKEAVPSGKTVKTRDPYEPISGILDTEHPRIALIELCSQLENDEPAMDYWKYFHTRSRVFFEIICRCPLRIAMFGLMTGTNLKVFDKPDRNGLGQRHYQIYFPKADFKNERYLDEDFYFDLPASLNDLLDTYLYIAWPAIHGRPFTTESRVFQTKNENDPELDPSETTDSIVNQMDKTCRRITARYLSDKYKIPGFYAQAIRHIIATDVIKSTGSFEEAARLLWDSVETVRETYAHILKAEELGKAAARLELDFVNYRIGRAA